MRYRFQHPLKGEFCKNDPEYRYSLRRIGHRFIKLLPDSNIAKFFYDYSSHLKDNNAIGVLNFIYSNPKIQKKICEDGFKNTLNNVIRSEYAVKMTQSELIGIYKEIVDSTIRSQIRHAALLNPFGFVLGMTLAQQYGFSSEFLDFSSDIRVAAFFATHTAPEFLWDKSQAQLATNKESLGVIYRLPSTKGQLAHRRLDEHDYYTCPGQIHLEDLCRRFEDKSAPANEGRMGRQSSTVSKNSTLKCDDCFTESN